MSESKIYSQPRIAATKLTVYPTGYDESTLIDKHKFCYYVEQYEDTGRWRVHDGWERDRLLSNRTGKWIRNQESNRRYTRFDSCDEACAAALAAIDKREFGTLIEVTDRVKARRSA